MKCEKGCKPGTKVLRTSDTGSEVRRHRHCLGCGQRFWTTELLDLEATKPTPEPVQTVKQPRKRTLAEDEKEMMEEMEKAQLRPWSVGQAETALGSDLKHFNEFD
jgi:transcriptional regulator NrdR family protein